VVLQGCHSGVTEARRDDRLDKMVVTADHFLLCYSGVTVVLQGCCKSVYKNVTRVLQECYKGVTRVLQGCSKVVTRVLQGCYKSVTRPQ
jgi:hypothetical protein